MYTRAIGLLALFTCWAPHALGHGTPIQIDAGDNPQTTTSNGLIDLRGYASLVFADPIEDSSFIEAPGDRLITAFPGFDVNGEEVDRQLNLHVLAIPATGPRGDLDRLLWYWSPLTEAVEPTPAEQRLQLFSQRNLGSLEFAESGAAPPVFTIADPLGPEMGSHRHLLYYILNNAPAAPVGTYAFFARISTNAHQLSEPILVALNHGLSSEVFQQAALAINRAALLPGDANRDFSVNIADFALLRRNFNQSNKTWADGEFSGNGVVDIADFAILRNNFAKSRVQIAPEGNAGLWITSALSAVLWIRKRRRQR